MIKKMNITNEQPMNETETYLKFKTIQLENGYSLWKYDLKEKTAERVEEKPFHVIEKGEVYTSALNRGDALRIFKSMGI